VTGVVVRVSPSTARTAVRGVAGNRRSGCRQAAQRRRQRVVVTSTGRTLGRLADECPAWMATFTGASATGSPRGRP
jgi:hypothetical protein